MPTGVPSLPRSMSPLMDGMVCLSLDRGSAVAARPVVQSGDVRGVKRQLTLTSLALTGEKIDEIGTAREQKVFPQETRHKLNKRLHVG